jgi:CheY-like chemotaxis protein
MAGLGNRILVVDDERFFIALVHRMLIRYGYDVETASSALEGLDRARTRRPDLIISDIMMPKVDGFTFLKQVRSDPKLAMIPFLFLTAIDDRKTARIKGFRLGADDFLPKEDVTEELLVRVEAILSRQQVRRQSDTDSAMSGSLAEIGVAAVLQMMAMEEKTGLVAFEGAPGTAQVWVVDGTPMAAVLPDLGLEGEEAVYAALNWESGSFSFSSSLPACRRNIRSSMQLLLLEGARLIDEAMARGA